MTHVQSTTWRPHTRKILLHCALVTTPLLASSIIILYIVYANLVSSNCSNQELCSRSEFSNITSKGIYFVDFSAAKLAFISSWSSTVSFALVGFLMAFAAYASGLELLRASVDNGDQEQLPTPHQMSVLLRVLNAELMALWDLGVYKIKSAFRKQDPDREARHKTSPILQTSVYILIAGILASLLVQVADVYFHISATSIELTQIHPLPPSSSQYQYSRGLAPWCLNRPSQGPLGPKKFWGCAITAQLAPYNNGTTVAPTNATTIQDLKNDISDLHRVLTYVSPDNIPYAVIAPADVDASRDWKATSFAVSTTCAAIPENGCVVSKPITNATDGQSNPIMLVPFNCTRNSTGIDIAGFLTSHNTATHMMGFHKYAYENTPFFNDMMVNPPGMSPQEILLRVEEEDPDEVFKNGWRVLVSRKIPSAVQANFDNMPISFQNDSRIWKHNLLGAFALMLCNVSVWDITYTASSLNITSLNPTLSNGSTSGLSSLPGTRFLGTLSNVFQDLSTGPLSRVSPSGFIRSFELGMAKAYSFPLASQLSSRPALEVQERTSKVVTRLPMSALWFLVLANLSYAVLGLALAVWAMLRVSRSPEAHQVQMRLSVAGLAAALFDREMFEQEAETDEGLFEEKRRMGIGAGKRVGVRMTEMGGSAFEVVDFRGRGVEGEMEMRRRYFGGL
ncbi:hypothetical protein BCR34DRAFT_590145 [Clohesyomyces aquaticus]|uniref:Uncharacterized protein n=1 Tax=Clohesyomyces aquaticus TaxID=1231657 RepID=A0A1Y1ZDQ0_9PLEO|nr:hypothetical protein BCR34DRAFT_590145 [Clohesyomyces aquaticus]